MRLINIHTLELKEFQPSEVPPFAILSHRWSRDEIEFEHFNDPSKHESPGYEKVVNLCRTIRNQQETLENGQTTDTVDWVWIDTCCIDKRNFTEYSEAINSMWKWYQQAAFCVVYLADVSQSQHRRQTLTALRKSEWFTRGWTLQEVLAPKKLLFHSRQWQSIGSNNDNDLMESVARATSIPREYLGHQAKRVREASVAQRMSWASARITTKPEDLAYCLLGLFDVNMALLYGEGPQNAFQRLQKAILDRYDDESLFAFTPQAGQQGALATSPKDFAHCGNVIKCTRQERPAYFLTNRGLQFNSPAIDVTADYNAGEPSCRFAIELNCARASDDGRHTLCSLGLKKKDSRFLRDISVEKAFDATPKARAEEKLDRGIWQWKTTERFYIHISRECRSVDSLHPLKAAVNSPAVFSKARDWLAARCPIRRYVLRSSTNNPRRETMSRRKKDHSINGKPRGPRSNTVHVQARNIDDNIIKHMEHQSITNWQQAPGILQTQSRLTTSPERQMSEVIENETFRWARDHSVGPSRISNWPLRPQWNETHQQTETRGRRMSKERYVDEENSYRSKGAKEWAWTDYKSSGLPDRGDSGYISDHSEFDGDLLSTWHGHDSTLSVQGDDLS